MAKLKRKKALLEQASLNSPKGDDDMVVLHGEAFEATVAMARCFKMATLHLMLHLSPKYTCRIHYGITETLNSMLLRYNEHVNGIILAYKNVQLTNAVSEIFFENPRLHVPVTVSFLVFAPSTNDVLVGEINQISNEHVGLVVLGNFNASISADMLKQYYYWNVKDSCWMKRTVKKKRKKDIELNKMDHVKTDQLEEASKDDEPLSHTGLQVGHTLLFHVLSAERLNDTFSFVGTPTPPVS